MRNRVFLSSILIESKKKKRNNFCVPVYFYFSGNAVSGVCFFGAKQVFDVPVSAVDWGFAKVLEAKSRQCCFAKIEDFADDAVADFLVFDDAADGGDFFACRFKLGFDEHNEESVFFDAVPGGNEDQFERDKGKVSDDEVVLFPREFDGVEVSRVDFFEVGDARVSAEFFVELSVSDIDAGDVCGSVLEEAVGETAGRGTDIEGVRSRDIEFKIFNRPEHFFAAAGDESRGCLDKKFCRVGQHLRGFLNEGIRAAAHFSSHNEDFCLGARSRFSLQEQEFVRPDFFHLKN